MKLDELLVRFGFARNFTKVLLYCAKHIDEDILLRDIERATDLRQPEVSVAMKDLVERKWVEAKTLPVVPGTTGRPRKLYRMLVTPKWISEHIAAEIYERIDKDKKLAEDIRSAMGRRS